MILRNLSIYARLSAYALIAAPILTPPAWAQTAPVPVTAAIAARGDVDVMAAGAGTVQATDAALLRARVDGVLEAIHFTEGQAVHEGDELATIDTRPFDAALNAARAARDGTAAKFANAQRDYARVAALANTPAGSPQRADTAASLAAQLAAELRGDEAAVANAELNLSYCHITAPFDGITGLRLADPGNLVHATDATGIVSITRVEPITVVFTLPQSDVAQALSALGAGIAEVRVSATADPATIATGTLLAANNEIDTATGTIALKAEFANADHKLWPGELVTARVRLAILKNAVTVPPAAVQRGPQGLYAYVLDQDNHAVLRQVILAYEDDSVAAIASGIAPGDKIVVSGQSRLAPGIAASPQIIPGTK
jgi:multidrug efflux system membrane fusion protein